MLETENDEFIISDEEVSEKEKEKEVPPNGGIMDASNFDELFSLIKQKGGITGSKQKYEAEYLIAVIQNFRKIFSKLIDTANTENPFKKTNLLEIFFQLLNQFDKITKKEELRFKVLQLLLRKIKKTK